MKAIGCAAAVVLAACSSRPAAERGAEPPALEPEPVAVETERSPALEAPLLEGVGSHHREISTDDELVQRFFDQGLALHYGFNHAEAARSFAEAARLDPECAVCFAGVALTLGPNINSQMDPDDVDRAYRAIKRAEALSHHASIPNQRLIEAISTRYVDAPAEDRAPLDRAYARSMGAVFELDPRDADVRALYAEALMVLHPWNYWAKDGAPRPWTPEILELLEAGLEAHPLHPFLNHLYIHLVEASEKPERALPSARRLETLAPGLGHLVHMPAHVYIRTGDYHRASLANERAIVADQRYLQQVEAQGLYPLAYYPHNYHFLWATTLLEGRSERSIEAARALAERADREQMRKPGFATLQHYASTPYYALVALGRWDAILDEPKPTFGLPYPEAVWHYARGMARAATGDLAAARKHLAHVTDAAASPELEKVTIWDINRTVDLMKIASAVLASEIARHDGQPERAVRHLERAVALEDALNYDEPPPWGPSTRRYLGAALLDAGQPARAAEIYREDLERFPDNGWSLYGLLESTRALGDADAAREIAARFERAWRHADVVLTSSRM